VRLVELRQGGLTLPELAAYVEHLPPGSACWAHLNGVPLGWSLDTLLLTDIYAATRGQAHPARTEISDQARAKSALARLRAQKARLNSS